MKKIIIIVVVLSIILGILFWRFGYLLQSKKGPASITLKIWGLWENTNLFRPAIDAYQKTRPNVKIEYEYKNSANYRTRVQTQIGDDKGPDIFMVHNTWLPMFLKNNNLSVTPASIITLDEFKKTFYPVAAQTLTKNNAIYALPLEIDGLALYYNEDIIKEANVPIPQNWDQFVDIAVALTQKDSKGNITRAGAAMGTAGNVDYWSDIIGLLFLQQPGANLEHPANNAGADVLGFYTNFVKNQKRQTWSLTMESSTEAFASGKLAFYFAPSWRAHDLRVLNQNLNFKTAPVPQLPKVDSSEYAAWGSFWAFAVSNKSLNQTQAWDFLKFLTSAQTEKLLYQEASKVRLFGEPYSRVDLQKELENSPIEGSFVKQGPIYGSWYLSSKTHDSGINDEMIPYFENAVNAVLQDADPLKALQTTEEGVAQILEKYTKSSQANPPQGQ